MRVCVVCVCACVLCVSVCACVRVRVLGLVWCVCVRVCTCDVVLNIIFNINTKLLMNDRKMTGKLEMRNNRSENYARDIDLKSEKRKTKQSQNSNRKRKTALRYPIKGEGEGEARTTRKAQLDSMTLSITIESFASHYSNILSRLSSQVGGVLIGELITRREGRAVMKVACVRLPFDNKKIVDLRSGI